MHVGLERTQWLKKLAVFQDLCSVSSIHIRWLITVYNFNSTESDDFPPWPPCLLGRPHAGVHHINKNQNFKKNFKIVYISVWLKIKPFRKITEYSLWRIYPFQPFNFLGFSELLSSKDVINRMLESARRWWFLKAIVVNVILSCIYFAVVLTNEEF